MNDDNDPIPLRESGNGRFVKGHKPINNMPRQPGELLVENPKHPDRDTRGRYLYAPNRAADSQMSFLKKAALEAVTPEQVQAVMGELFNLALDRGTEADTRLKAMEMYLDRTIGKPAKEINIQKEQVKHNVNYNLHKLSNDDLAQLETLLTKTQPAAEQGPEIIIGE